MDDLAQGQHCSRFGELASASVVFIQATQAGAAGCESSSKYGQGTAV